MRNQEKIKETAEKLLDIFQKESLPILARAVFKTKNQKPSDLWSFQNRILMMLSGTQDARGIRQWNSASRRVKAGCKAFYILAPSMSRVIKDIENEDPETGEVKTEKKEFNMLKGFLGVPVFRYEDTQGEPLPVDDFRVDIPACFTELINFLELKIETIPFNGRAYGSYLQDQNRINLATPEIETFLHEISHAVDKTLNGKLKPWQDSEQEIIAEFSGAIIGYLLGYKISLGNIQEYIKAYAGDIKKVYGLLGRIEKVCSFIFQYTMETKPELKPEESLSLA